MSFSERFWEIVCPFKDLAKAGGLLSLVFLVLAIVPLLSGGLARPEYVVSIVSVVILIASTLGFGLIQYRCRQEW